MGSRERAIDIGAAQGRELRHRIAREARSARLSAGLSQDRVATALGLSRSQLSRIERGRCPLDLETGARLFAVLGLDLAVRAFPAGDPVRDAAQLALIGRLRSAAHPSIRWRTEVPFPDRGDLRAWDATGIGPAVRVAAEAETRLHDLQALGRRLALKKRDGGFDRLVLVVADTRLNRSIVREHADWVSEAFPLPGRRALELLRAGVQPDEDSLILL
jgi:transcriptional regulator with XRE-family HTH domain